MATIKQNLTRSRELPDSDSARLDIEVLLSHVLGCERVWLYTWPEYELSPIQQQEFDKLLARRVKGEPVAYLTGQREFWSLPLKVNPSTLIPRPETELLVELALQFFPQEKLRVLDLGTGTGAIALALASERPGWQILAVDKSPEAVALAEENRCTLGFNNVQIIQSDWFAQIPPQKFDLILSNPPYIDATDPHLMGGDVRFEPRSALVAGHEGLADITHIARHCCQYLRDRGWLMVEHGWRQAAGVREVFARVGLVQIVSHEDHMVWERVTMGRHQLNEDE